MRWTVFSVGGREPDISSTELQKQKYKARRPTSGHAEEEEPRLTDLADEEACEPLSLAFLALPLLLVAGRPSLRHPTTVPLLRTPKI